MSFLRQVKCIAVRAIFALSLFLLNQELVLAQFNKKNYEWILNTKNPLFNLVPVKNTLFVCFQSDVKQNTHRHRKHGWLLKSRCVDHVAFLSLNVCHNVF